MRPDNTCFCVQEKHLLVSMGENVDFMISPICLCLTVKYQCSHKGAFAEKDMSAPHFFRIILSFSKQSEVLLTALP